MFTGLIQGLGILQTIGATKLQITVTQDTSGLILSDLALGDSMAVDGVCLTVVEILPRGFVADASPETRDRTTLGRMEGAIVNLEPSLRVGSKLGGHFVTGHVDGLGVFRQAIQTATSWEMTFDVTAAQVARYLVPKGSITVNGISLTVADCDPEGSWFTVAIIPLTYAETNLHTLQMGQAVNLEGDILGKYVEKFLRSASLERSPSNPVTAAFLAEHGYL